MTARITAEPMENIEAKPEAPQADPWTAVFMRDLAVPPGALTNLKPEPPKEPDKPKEQPKKEAAAAPAPEKPKEEQKPEPIAITMEAPIGRQVEEAVERVLDSRIPKPVEAVKAPEPPKDTDADYVAGLPEAQRRKVALADYAEQNDPSNKGLKREYIDYLKMVDKYLADHEGEEGRNFDANDEDYAKFVRLKQPKRFTEEHQKLIEVEKRTEERVVRKLTPEIEKVRVRADEGEATARTVAAKPKIEQAVKLVEAQALDLDAGDNEVLKEVIDTVKTKGREAALEVDPVYAQIVNHHLDHANTVSAEFSALTNGVKNFDAQNPVHKYILDFMEAQGRHIADHGSEEMRVRRVNGKTVTFIPRIEYATMANENPIKAKNHFTFSDDDILGMFAINTKQMIQHQAKIVQERLAKAGWTRAKKGATPPPAAQEPPKAATKPATQRNGAPEPENDDDVDSPRLGGGAPAPASGKGNVISGGGLFSEAELQALIPR